MYGSGLYVHGHFPLAKEANIMTRNQENKNAQSMTQSCLKTSSEIKRWGSGISKKIFTDN